MSHPPLWPVRGSQTWRSGAQLPQNPKPQHSRVPEASVTAHFREVCYWGIPFRHYSTHPNQSSAKGRHTNAGRATKEVKVGSTMSGPLRISTLVACGAGLLVEKMSSATNKAPKCSRALSLVGPSSLVSFLLGAVQVLTQPCCVWSGFDTLL